MYVIIDQSSLIIQHLHVLKFNIVAALSAFHRYPTVGIIDLWFPMLFVWASCWETHSAAL